MSSSDSETQSKMRNREASKTDEVLKNSVFGIFMDFADKAMTIVLKQQKPRRISMQSFLTFSWIWPTAANRTHDEEHERFVGAGEEFKKLPPGAKERVLKELWVETAWSLLERLPEEGKEAFLARCFNGLYQKLPEESREKIDEKVKDVLSSSQGAAMEGEESDSEGAQIIRRDDLVEVGHDDQYRPPQDKLTKVKKPKTIGSQTQTSQSN